MLTALRRPKNCDLRDREYLTSKEIDALIQAAKRLGRHGAHPLTPNEIHALHQLKQAYPSDGVLFLSERQRPLTAHTVRKILTRAGKAARLPVSVHPQMLRHSTCYALIKQGVPLQRVQHYLGHKNIQHTARYAAPIDGAAEQNVWQDK